MMRGVVKEDMCKNCRYPIWFDGQKWGHYPVNEDGEPPICDDGPEPDS